MGALIPLEPDHLCSLIALNAGVTTLHTASYVGLKWGFGHCLGMMVVCLVFLPLQSLIHVDLWEFYGNYAAGALLCIIGVYFLAFESQYLEVGEDGSWKPKQAECSCCSTSLTIATKPSRSNTSGHTCDDGCCSDPESPESETSPLMPPEERTESSLTSRFVPKSLAHLSLGDLRGVLVGLFQGLCCPSCIAGLAFVGQMGAQHPGMSDITLFFLFSLLSILSCSCIVSVCVVAFGRGAAFCLSLSTRTMFRGACICSIILGSVWIALNACGKLHVIQYTHALEEDLHMSAVSAFQDGSSVIATSAHHNLLHAIPH